MRILAFTGGAAQMYCGSCLRDNALAAELRAQDHDVTLLPLYTPTLTDEANVSDEHVFFGGVSVYLEQQSAVFSKLPGFVDRLWDSGPLLRWAAKRSIPTSPRFLGELTVSMLEGRHGRQAREFDKLLDWLRGQPRPDVISLPYTLLSALARPLKEALGAPIACTLQGEDLYLEGLAEPWRTRSLDLIRANLEHVDVFLPVSHYYSGFMSEYLESGRTRCTSCPSGST